MLYQQLAEARIAEQKLLLAELLSRPTVELPVRHRYRRWRWRKHLSVERPPRSRPVVRIG